MNPTMDNPIVPCCSWELLLGEPGVVIPLSMWWTLLTPLSRAVIMKKSLGQCELCSQINRDGESSFLQIQQEVMRKIIGSRLATLQPRDPHLSPNPLTSNPHRQPLLTNPRPGFHPRFPAQQCVAGVFSIEFGWKYLWLFGLEDQKHCNESGAYAVRAYWSNSWGSRSGYHSSSMENLIFSCIICSTFWFLSKHIDS